jgi:hypothetical protein
MNHIWSIAVRSETEEENEMTDASFSGFFNAREQAENAYVRGMPASFV